MKIRLSALVGAALLTGALATGCSSGSDEGDAAAATPGSTERPGMGVAVAGDGATVTVNAAYETDSVDLYTDGSWASGEERPTEATKARDGGKYIVVETTVVNDTTSDMDLTCRHTGGYVDAVLQTDPKAIYQPVKDLYKVPGNPECNVNLGPGFDTAMTWIFLVPEARHAVAFNFLTKDSGKDDLASVRLDRFGDRPTTSKIPAPTTGEEAGETDGTGEDAAPDVLDPAEDYSADDIPVDTAGVPDDSPAYDVPASAPAYGVPCSASQVLQPSTGADGTPLVCVGMGGDNGQLWVYGPEAQGAGTASDGAVCAEGEAGGQDEEGRMMMCSQGQWVYGP